MLREKVHLAQEIGIMLMAVKTVHRISLPAHSEPKRHSTSDLALGPIPD